jgi:hypothetical protein
VIDFDGLVLAPAMEIFARPITVTPLKSQPGHPAFEARGVWASKPVDVPLEDGSILSSQDHRLGVRWSEFLVPLAQGDQIEVDAHLSAPRLGIFLIEDGDDDGQGGTDLSLKWIAP